MIDWIRKVSAILPEEYKNILLFNTFTGLRPDEARKAIWLTKTRENDYVDKERSILKHYQFPETFLRQTKNAYVSIIIDQFIEFANGTPNKENYMADLRKQIIKKGYTMNLYNFRKVFATYLRNKGLEPEIIDLLQGRIGSSVKHLKEKNIIKFQNITNVLIFFAK